MSFCLRICRNNRNYRNSVYFAGNYITTQNKMCIHFVNSLYMLYENNNAAKSEISTSVARSAANTKGCK